MNSDRQHLRALGLLLCHVLEPRLRTWREGRKTEQRKTIKPSARLSDGQGLTAI